MNDSLTLTLRLTAAWLAGGALGAIFFGGLWWTALVWVSWQPFNVVPGRRIPFDWIPGMPDGGGRILPRMIRYIEERRVHERRWTGAIEAHPSPLQVIWGDVDPVAVWPMAERIGHVRSDAIVHRLDGVGHYPMVESPARFNAALQTALA